MQNARHTPKIQLVWPFQRSPGCCPQVTSLCSDTGRKEGVFSVPPPRAEDRTLTSLIRKGKVHSRGPISPEVIRSRAHSREQILMFNSVTIICDVLESRPHSPTWGSPILGRPCLSLLWCLQNVGVSAQFAFHRLSLGKKKQTNDGGAVSSVEMELPEDPGN